MSESPFPADCYPFPLSLLTSFLPSFYFVTCSYHSFYFRKFPQENPPRFPLKMSIIPAVFLHVEDITKWPCPVNTTRANNGLSSTPSADLNSSKKDVHAADTDCAILHIAQLNQHGSMRILQREHCRLIGRGEGGNELLPCTLLHLCCHEDGLFSGFKLT